MIGPGRYDDECTAIRESSKARGVLVMVIGGNKGPGFSCQMDAESTRKLPDLLRHMADQIDADLKKGKL